MVKLRVYELRTFILLGLVFSAIFTNCDDRIDQEHIYAQNNLHYLEFFTLFHSFSYILHASAGLWAYSVLLCSKIPLVTVVKYRC